MYRGANIKWGMVLIKFTKKKKKKRKEKRNVQHKYSNLESNRLILTVNMHNRIFKQ